MKNKNKDIYSVTLYMIDNDKPFYTYSDIKEMEDIYKYASLKKVKEILVYKMHGRFREIITDMEIAGLERYPAMGETLYFFTKKSPLFFCYSSKKNSAFTYFIPLKLVTPKQLEEYLNKNLNNIGKNIDMNYVDSKALFLEELKELETIAEDEFTKFSNEHNIFTKDMKKRNKEKMKKIMKDYGM